MRLDSEAYRQKQEEKIDKHIQCPLLESSLSRCQALNFNMSKTIYCSRGYEAAIKIENFKRQACIQISRNLPLLNKIMLNLMCTSFNSR